MNCPSFGEQAVSGSVIDILCQGLMVYSEAYRNHLLVKSTSSNATSSKTTMDALSVLHKRPTLPLNPLDAGSILPGNGSGE